MHQRRLVADQHNQSVSCLNADALSLASSVDGWRHLVVEALKQSLPNCDPVLYEASVSGTHFRATWPVAASATALLVDGRVLRWLRVNDEMLGLAGRVEIADVLGRLDYGGDDSGRVQPTYLPFVASGDLLAVVLLTCVDPTSVDDSRRQSIVRFVRQAAEILRRLREQAAVETAAMGALRSQQLSSVGQLAATLAHEVRNPLAAIRSLVQFIRDTAPKPERQAPLLTEIISEIDRVSTTIARTLQHSRVGPSEVTTIDVNTILGELEMLIAPYARRRRVALGVAIGDGEIRVRANPVELRQVVTNLIMNGCQACARGGRVDVAVEPSRPGAGTCDITIVDDGLGIPDSILHRLGEPFLTTKRDGTGLGVVFCYSAVKRAGGQLVFDSKEGRGTRVTVTLPREGQAWPRF